MKMCLVKPTNTWGSLSDRLVKQLLGDALEPPNEAGGGLPSNFVPWGWRDFEAG